MALLTKLLTLLNGKKTLFAYILANLPFLTPYPLLVNAITDIISKPGDPTAIGNLVIQVLFVIGLGHKVVKGEVFNAK